MNIECEVCKTVFKIKDGIIPPGSKINYTCKKCKHSNSVPLGGSQTSVNGDPTSPAQDRPANVPSADHGNNRATFLKEKILAGIKDLPPMPQVVMEIHNQLSGENINTKKISDSIETDQAIASKVLRLANSAYYGMSGRIPSILS